MKEHLVEVKRGASIALFAFKVCHGIFDEVTDIIYYQDQVFQYPEIKNSILFFLLLSPIIQAVAWTVLLTKIRVASLKRSSNEQGQQSQSSVGNNVSNTRKLLQKIFDCIAFYMPIVLRQIPQSFAISLLQEIKVFPFFLFGYTYFEYKAIITRDLMRNIAPHLNYFEKQELKGDKKVQNSMINMLNPKREIELEDMRKPPAGIHFEGDSNRSAHLHQLNKQSIGNTNEQTQGQQQQQPILREKQKGDHLNSSIENPYDTKRYYAVKRVNQLPEEINESQLQLDLSDQRNHTATKIVDDTTAQEQSTILIEQASIKFKRAVQKLIYQIKQEKQSQQQQRIAASEGNKVTKNSSDAINKKREESRIEDDAPEISQSIDLLIDANISPTLDFLISDHNLQQFILITDIIEAVFEALPMAVLQYINNGINSSWLHKDGTLDYFLVISFVTSIATIIIHSISLLIILYDENISTFYNTLSFLKRIKKRQQQHIKLSQAANINMNSEQQIEGFSKIFQMKPKVRIITMPQLHKLCYLRKNACRNIVDLTFDLKPQMSEASNAISTIFGVVKNFKSIERLEIEFNNNKVKLNVNPFLKDILISKQLAATKLQRIALHFYGNELMTTTMSRDKTPSGISVAGGIYATLNDWVLSAEGDIEEIIFESETIFVWRAPDFNSIYPGNSNSLVKNRLQKLFNSSTTEKRFVDIVLSDKDILLSEATAITDALSSWTNLVHFQLLCRRFPQKQEAKLLQTLEENPNLESSLVGSRSQGILFRKGFHLQCPLNHQNLKYIHDTLFEPVISFSLKNEGFYFNYDAIKFIFKEQLLVSHSILIERAVLNFDCIPELSQAEVPMKRAISNQTVKCLMRFIPTFKNVESLEINFGSNDLRSGNGETYNSIGNGMNQLKKLKHLSLNLNSNGIARSDCIAALINPMILSQKSFISLNLNLSNNQIENEGLQYLIRYLQICTGQSIAINGVQSINIAEFQRSVCGENAAADYSTRDQHFEGEFTQKTTKIVLTTLTLNLSNTRLSTDSIEQLLDAVFRLKYLEELNLSAKGNVFSLEQKGYDFSDLIYLNKLSLNFWFNDFSPATLNNLFRLLRAASHIESLNLSLVSNNLKDNCINEYEGFLQQFKSLRELKLNFSGNGREFTRVPELSHVFNSNPKLKVFEMNLEACNFSVTEVSTIVSSIEVLQELESLKLNFSSNPSFNDSCCVVLLEKISTLFMLNDIELNFASTQITDNSVEFVSKEILNMSSLKSASFDFHTQFTTKKSLDKIVHSFVLCPHIQFPYFNV